MVLSFSLVCPNALYTDEDGDWCYFLVDDSITTEHKEARESCERYDKDATQVVIDSSEKLTHIISNGILDSAT